MRWFRKVAVAIRDDGLEDQFRLFLGTRILVDAAREIDTLRERLQELPHGSERIAAVV